MIEQLEGDLGNVYPNARNAIAYHEQLSNGVWAMVRGANRGLDETIKGLIGCADKTLQAAPGGLLAAARGEMETADFRLYVAGKLGLM